jgi:hypothetical protein
MNQFLSIRKPDQGILYNLELAPSLSVLLLAFGLIASMANVLTKGSVLSANIGTQRKWAWAQCIAVDAYEQKRRQQAESNRRNSNAGTLPDVICP